MNSIKNKFLTAVMLIAAFFICASEVRAGILASNIVAGSNLIYTGRLRVYQIVAYGATDNVLTFHDSNVSSNAYTQASYVRSTNITLSVTNLTTNGIFEYATTTQYLIQTNIYVNGNFRTNITVSAGVVGFPVQSTVPLVASVITTLDGIDFTFLRGVLITATNSATVILYTRD